MPTFAREKARVSKRDRLFYTLSALMFLFTILVYTYPSVQMVQLTYSEQEIRKKERKQVVDHNQLSLEFEMLIAPDEMEDRSLKAGFAVPDENQVVYIKKIK